MINPRFLLGLSISAFAALILLFAYLSNFSSWLVVPALALFIGLGIGLFLSRTVPGARELRTFDHEHDPGTVDFSSELLDVTVNEMRAGLLVIDPKLRVVASNRAARTLLSHADDSINARRLTELTRNPAIYDAFLDAVRGVERAGVKVETYGQGRRIFDLRVVPLRAGNGGAAGAVGVFFDVTRLERLEFVQQEILSDVSHELRTPLPAIIALAETLEAGAIDDQEHNRRFLSIIQKNAARMHRLIDDILELSAIEAGNVKVQPAIVQLRPLVEDVVGSLSAIAATRTIVVTNLVGPGVKGFADPP